SFFEIGLSLSLLAVLVAFNWTSKERTSSLLIAEYQEIVEEEEQIPITLYDPPPPPEIPRIPQIPDIITVVDDDIDIASTLDFSDLETGDFIKDYIYRGTKQVIEDPKDVEETVPFVIVEVKPLFQGKEAEKFRDWIYSQLVYPEEALTNNIQGTVRISFTVNTDGTLSDIKSIKKTDPLLEECVIEIVKKSPKWTPGRQQNKPVKVPYQVPILFKIQQ
ncbi:MAG: energy transducer TonB, partial [Prevotellaceae bacterium]|nr:energy transducer TonB [Prevotellaceae bacterium]